MADQLMYVKEDLILPHHYTFYDFIVTKVNLAYKFYFINLHDVINTLLMLTSGKRKKWTTFYFRCS